MQRRGEKPRFTARSQMSVIDAPGARLYYEIEGSGPLLLMVPGANGDGRAFQRVTPYLAPQWTVVTYDRRGFSRSPLTGPQDELHRLDTDADDVARLIEHVSDGPAAVFGASSGALVALRALMRHAGVTRTVIPYEPPAVALLSDGQQWLEMFGRVYAIYEQSGLEPALQQFRERAFAESDRQAMGRAMDLRSEQVVANARYWFEHELRQYPAAQLDMDLLRARADRVVPAAGRESRGYPAYEVSRVLSNELGRNMVELPGGHVGYMTQPAEFGTALVQALTRPDDLPPA